MEDYKGIDVNSVRLAFQVFLLKEKPIVRLPPVFSDAIYDKKANADLVIFRISDATSYPVGGKQIILLCEKVAKDDIMIRFYELKDKEVVWEAYGAFQMKDIHRQVAITFRTPKYRHTTISDPVDVLITLQRRSDGVESEPRSFQYIPDWSGTGKKRKIDANAEFYNFFKTDMIAKPTELVSAKTVIQGKYIFLTYYYNVI